MSVQYITTPAGETLAVLPKSEYEALIERLEDIVDMAAAADVLARINEGEEELIPAAVVKRIVDGESKVRVWREHRGMSVTALAKASGLSQAYVSQIENGARAARPDKRAAIAEALNLDVDDLF
jgi:predicted DNA-binding protein